MLQILRWNKKYFFELISTTIFRQKKKQKEKKNINPPPSPTGL